MVLAPTKAIRIVLLWQVAASGAVALGLALLAGVHGLVSGILGGLVGICAGLAFSVVVSLSRSDSLAGTLAAAFRAEAVKVVTAVILLWLVFTIYKDVVAIGFIGAFAVSILIFGMALFVRDA
jgi:ATP synthase protein I